MNTYLIFVVAILLFVVVRMTQVSIKRKESPVMIAWSGGVVGACFMLLCFLVMTWW